ncbi:MAG: elongation factor Ts [Bacteroidetes bacterium]|jgi:elongation factor Ts|nr:elongation factor Ts [Bacteroidota bacterium]MBT6686726.1 elongation factor Ts [Bacteroidota bacterium]MBT7142749.1 elongation factor Ts [Bacteroidota bacterium]MBT7492888.1 elongation factor Ts [Bacteroidota bacterium]
MAGIKAAEVKRLRDQTGAGMMDCKKALQETNGDFDQAVDVIRKKGQAIANKRAEREATEGVVLSQVSADEKSGIMIVLNCETDFVAKNEKFIDFAKIIADLATAKQVANLDELLQLELNGKTLAEEVVEQSGIIGEKVALSFYSKIDAEKVVAYIHAGNMLATLVGFNNSSFEQQLGKDVAMQVAAMNPVAIDKENVSQEVIDKEIEIGKEQALREGKPEKLLEKIAFGKLNKFFKDNTLANQDFIKDNKMTVKQYITANNKDLKITEFKRFALKS